MSGAKIIDGKTFAKPLYGDIKIRSGDVIRDYSLPDQLSDNLVASSISGNFQIGEEHRASSMVLYARYLKRIGAHLKNITSVVVNPFESIGYKK